MNDQMSGREAVRILEERLSALDRLVHVQFEAHRAEMQAALHGNEKRVGNIYTSLDRIRDSVNMMVSSEEYDRRHDTIDARLSRLEASESRGRGVVVGVSVTLGLLVGGFVALALHLFG